LSFEKIHGELIMENIFIQDDKIKILRWGNGSYKN
jgi:hypothetical protein